MKIWLNVYPSGYLGNIANGYRTRTEADMVAHPLRIACIEVECSVGEGLNFVQYGPRDRRQRDLFEVV